MGNPKRHSQVSSLGKLCPVYMKNRICDSAQFVLINSMQLCCCINSNFLTHHTIMHKLYTCRLLHYITRPTYSVKRPWFHKRALIGYVSLWSLKIDIEKNCFIFCRTSFKCIISTFDYLSDNIFHVYQKCIGRIEATFQICNIANCIVY